MLTEHPAPTHTDLVTPLASSHKILVVGVRPGNLSPDLEQHARVICWSTDDHLRSQIPSDVGRVIITRFLGNEMFDKLKHEADRRRIRFDRRPYSTGALKRLLHVLLGDEPPAELDAIMRTTDSFPRRPASATLSTKLGAVDIKMVEPKPQPPQPKTYSTVQEFLVGELRQGDNESYRQMAERLYPLLPKHGLEQPSFGGFYQRVLNFSKRLGLQSPPESPKLKLPPPEAPDTVPPSSTWGDIAAPVPQVTTFGQIGPNQQQRRASDIIGDTIVALQLAIDSLKELETRITTLENAEAVRKQKLREMLGE